MKALSLYTVGELLFPCFQNFPSSKISANGAASKSSASSAAKIVTICPKASRDDATTR